VSTWPYQMVTEFMESVDIISLPTKADTGDDMNIDLQPAFGNRMQYQMFPHEAMGPHSYMGWTTELGPFTADGPNDRFALKRGRTIFHVIAIRSWGSHYVFLCNEVRNA